MASPASDRNIHAERAVKRKREREQKLAQSRPTERQLQMQVRILSDRLALALHVFTSHEQFIKYETHTEWMKYLEEWAEEMVTVEERPAKGRKWRYDYYRDQQRYRYFRSGISALLRNQMVELGAMTEEQAHGEAVREAARLLDVGDGVSADGAAGVSSGERVGESDAEQPEAAA